jgi:hypothetical protein
MKRKYSMMSILIALILLLFISSCDNIQVPASGDLIIAGGAETTDKRTPVLTIQSEGAAYMSFSGDGEEWTEWLIYSESYDEFDLASGEFGTRTGAGVKYVFVRFKDSQGNIMPTNGFIYDSIEYILKAPTSGSIIIAAGANSTSDTTPLLIIQSEGAAYMSFSGDGEEWTEWIPYSESYDEFDLASGKNGTEFSQGQKKVYVRFKNEQHERKFFGVRSSHLTFL